MKKKQILGLINDKLSKIVDILDKKNIIEYPWTSYDQKQLNGLIEESDKAISVTISGTPETGMQIEKGTEYTPYLKSDESKYYTPDIEELYEGFELEYFDEEYDTQKSRWFEYIYTILGTISDAIVSRFEHGKTLDGFIRVKYLDRSDIESLGFIKSDKLPISYETEDWFIYKASEAYGSNNWLIQLRQGGNIFDKFSGTIKNKSELIKILKMIGYEK